MVIDLVISLLSILLFLTLGSLFTRINLIASSLDRNLFSILAGITLCIFLSTTFVKIGLSSDYFIITSFLLLILSIFINAKKLKSLVQLKLGNIWQAALAIPVLIYAYLLNSSLFTPQLSLRNGPDTVGILSSARYLCENTSLERLQSNVANQLGSGNVEQILKSPIDAQGNSIYKIASFTDQVNAEFLLGAKRLGLPALGAVYCNIGGSEALFRFSNSIILTSVLLITLLVYSFLSNYSLQSHLKIAISLFASLNINLLAATLEGGIVQVFTIPFLLFFTFSLILKQHRKTAYGFFFLLLIALTTYYDLLFFVGIIILLYLAFTYKEIFNKERISLYRNLSYASLFAALLLPNEMLRVLNEVATRNNSLSWGGWDQGRKPTPANFMGLINWLPPDGVTNSSRSYGVILLEILVSVLLILTFFRYKQKSSFFVIALGILYVVLITQIYVLGTSPYNNYVALKVGAYLAPFSALAIGFMIFRDPKIQIGNSRKKTPMFFGYFFLLLNASAVFSWVADWNSNSFDTRIDQNLESIFEEYDVKIEGFKGAGTIQFILQGNLHYGNPSRAFEIPADRTPGRQLVHLVSKEKESRFGREDFVSIYETQEYQVWKAK
jgi:hypothetical protein